MKDEDFADLFAVNGDGGSEFSSPNFPHIHDPTVNLNTVSLQDIYQYPPGSTPMSALLSPFDDDTSYETSPLFASDDNSLGAEKWTSLFEPTNDGSPFEPNMEVEIAAILNAEPLEGDSSSASASASPATRNIGSGSGTLRKGAGVRKRSTPLPDIVVADLNDHVAVKRARNTLAARKSREKRVKKMEEMEVQIEELKGEVEHWKRLYQERA